MPKKQKIIKKITGKGLIIRYLLALGIIAGLAGVAFYLVQTSINLQKENGSVINITGNQRTLIEKITLIIEQINSQKIIRSTGLEVNSKPINTTRLNGAINKLLNSHNAIVNNDYNTINNILNTDPELANFKPFNIVITDKFTASKTVYDMYYGNGGIKEELNIFINEAKKLGSNTELIYKNEKIISFKMKKEHLIGLYDKLVLQLQKENEKDLQRLKHIETGVFLVTLIVLFIELYYIFVPLVRDIINYQESLEEAKNELSETNEELKLANQTKDEFLHIATHELRSPLTSMRGYLSMIQDGDTGKISDETRLYVTKVMKSAENLIHLINDMLDINKIEQGKMSFDFNKFDFKQLLLDLKEDAIQYGKNRNVGIKTDIKYDSLEINSDEHKLRQVFMNLLSNASKFSKPGSFVTIESYIEGDYILTSIIDTGIGIKPENVGKIFEKFGQVKDAQKGVKGTGLGLPIVKTIIEKVGGEINVLSKEGSGSTFTIKIPIQ